LRKKFLQANAIPLCKTEHHVLYQVNINKAKNVFIGLQEGEAPYWQGTRNTPLAPAPWTSSLQPSDPDFRWCGADEMQVTIPTKPTWKGRSFEIADVVAEYQCRMGLYQRIVGSSNLNIYSSGFWNFVSGFSRTMCSTDCQDNAALYEGNSKMFVYGFSTINSKNLIIETSGNSSTASVGATRVDNSGNPYDGFKTGVLAAYFKQSA
jgi:glucan 1,3-beta-glucosidase